MQTRLMDKGGLLQLETFRTAVNFISFYVYLNRNYLCAKSFIELGASSRYIDMSLNTFLYYNQVKFLVLSYLETCRVLIKENKEGEKQISRTIFK